MKRKLLCTISGRRNRAPGNAMVEFLLMLPFIIFIVGMGIYLAVGLRTKERLMVGVRYDVWRSTARYGNWWWTDDNDGSWPAWQGDANGPIGTGAATDTNHPRGTGEELEYLYANAGRAAEAITGNDVAEDYFRRIWNNLPGRQFGEKSFDYHTNTQSWNWLDTTIVAQHSLDSAPWFHGQEPPWLIAQFGPMLEIKNVFNEELANVPPEFRRMRDEVLHAWFEEKLLLDWNDPNAQIP